MDNIVICNFNKTVLDDVYIYLKKEKKKYEKKHKHNLGTRFDRISQLSGKLSIEGDKILYKLNDLFHNGMGVLWSPVQITIFNAAVDSMLPKIYGVHWDSVKTRVLKSRGLDKVSQELMIQMARRNGKTFVTAGTAAAFLLAIPGIQIAIFSVSERQSKMLKVEIDNRINAAFEKGTHVVKDDFTKIETNKEKWIYKMNSTGTKQVLGSFPGSVNVNFFFYLSCSLKKVSIKFLF